MVQAEEVDGGLGGGGPGLWRPVPSAPALSGRGTGARGYFAWSWALGWAWWGEALAPLRGEFPSVFGASVGLVFVDAEPDGSALLSSMVYAFWPVWGAAALVQLLLAVQDHPHLWPPIIPQVAEAVRDCALTPDTVACVVVAAGLLDLCGFLRTLGMPRVGAVLVAGGRMMRMPGPGGVVAMIKGRMTRMLGPGSPGESGGVRGVQRLLLSWLGWGRLRSLGWDRKWWGLGGVGLEEGVRSLLARIR